MCIPYIVNEVGSLVFSDLLFSDDRKSPYLGLVRAAVGQGPQARKQMFYKGLGIPLSESQVKAVFPVLQKRTRAYVNLHNTLENRSQCRLSRLLKTAEGAIAEELS